MGAEEEEEDRPAGRDAAPEGGAGEGAVGRLEPAGTSRVENAEWLQGEPPYWWLLFILIILTFLTVCL